MTNGDVYYRVTTRYYVAGFIVHDGRVVGTAPILKRLLGMETNAALWKLMGEGAIVAKLPRGQVPPNRSAVADQEERTMGDAGFININLSDVDDGRDPVPAGLRHVRVKSAQRKHKEGSEFPYIDVRLSPLDVDEKYQRRTLNLTLSFHPQALWNMKLFAAKAQIPFNQEGFHLDDFIGKELFVTVKHEPDQNDPEAIRASVNPPYVKA